MKFKIQNAPQDQPLFFDTDAGVMFSDPEDAESSIDISMPHAVATGVADTKPQWMSDFYTQMNGYVNQSSPKASIDGLGQLLLSPDMPKSSLKKVCDHLAWLYEAQFRQNKEILLWIGEVILDYMARSTNPVTIEEAIEELGLTKRENGVKWSMKTIARYPIVVQKIPPKIRQLNIPPTYLSEAALFSQPQDPVQKTQFCNARDAILVAISKSPDLWSRSKFVACMKELQEHFGMTPTRNEGVSALQERLIAYYRIAKMAAESGDIDAYYTSIGLDRKEVATWIYNIESALIDRNRLEPDPLEAIPKGDGLTETARNRVTKINKQKPN
jgi:hypothetical protein